MVFIPNLFQKSADVADVQSRGGGCGSESGELVEDGGSGAGYARRQS
ncbi:MAG: hypothetical protein K4304_06495 [Propionicimonas sp.]